MKIFKIVAVLFVTFLIFLGLVQEAHAQDSALKESGQSEIHTVTFSPRKQHRYRLDTFLNAYGEREVQISLIEAHWLAKDSELLVLRGRDTDGDFKVDAWFYSEGVQVKTLQRLTNGENTWAVAQQILEELSLNEPRWISTLVSRELLGGLFFTFEGEMEDAREIELAQINLLDLEYKIRFLETSKTEPVLLQELKRVHASGWKRFLERITSTQLEDRQKRLFGDVALFLGGAAALRGVRILLLKALSTETITSIKSSLQTLLNHQQQWFQASARRFAGVVPVPAKRAAETLAKSSAQLLVRLQFVTESEAISWFSRRSIFSHTLKQIGQFVSGTAMASWEKRGYIATAQTIQIAIESYNRGYWKFSDAPLILDHPVDSTKNFIQQVAQDKGLLQNVSYMTLQTTLLSGASEGLAKRGFGLKAKYAVCSIITLIDSATVNVLVQGRTDVSRVSFDTAWELVVGSSQIQLDLQMLRWANQLAAKYNNPKLKLVGYLLGSLDQAAGYALYNFSTSHFFEGKPSGSNPVIPADKGAPALTNLPPVVIVPVLAPS